MASWHIAQGEDVQGPYSDGEMHQLARGGRLKRHMYVSKDGGAWQAAHEIPELASHMAPPAPPPLAGVDRQLRRLAHEDEHRPGGARAPSQDGRRQRPMRRRDRMRAEQPPGTLRVGAFLCFGVVIGGLLSLLASSLLMIVAIWISQPPLLFLAFLGVDSPAFLLIVVVGWGLVVWPILWILTLKRSRGAWHTLIVTSVAAIVQCVVGIGLAGSGLRYYWGLGLLILLLPVLVHGASLACLLAPASRRFLNGRAAVRRRTARRYADTFE